MATDLPMPSGTKREVASLAATWITCTGAGSAARAMCIDVSIAPAIAVMTTARTNVPLANALVETLAMSLMSL